MDSALESDTQSALVDEGCTYNPIQRSAPYCSRCGCFHSPMWWPLSLLIQEIERVLGVDNDFDNDSDNNSDNDAECFRPLSSSSDLFTPKVGVFSEHTEPTKMIHESLQRNRANARSSPDIEDMMKYCAFHYSVNEEEEEEEKGESCTVDVETVPQDEVPTELTEEHILQLICNCTSYIDEVYSSIRKLIFQPLQVQNNPYPQLVCMHDYMQVWTLCLHRRNLPKGQLQQLKKVCKQIKHHDDASLALHKQYAKFVTFTEDHAYTLQDCYNFFQQFQTIHDVVQTLVLQDVYTAVAVEDVPQVPSSAVMSFEGIENVEKGLKWMGEVCDLYVKYGGDTCTPVTAKQMMEHFRHVIETLDDDDFHSLIYHIEYRLGNTTFEYITENLKRFIQMNHAALPSRVKMLLSASG